MTHNTEKTVEERVKELDYVHTEWGDCVHVEDVVKLLTEALSQRERTVREEILNLVTIPINPSNDDQREWYRGLGREEEARAIREKIQALTPNT